MPYAVACPVCGADGTAAADEAISQSLEPVGISATCGQVAGLQLAARPVLRAATPSVRTSARPASSLPKPDPGKIEAESRSKICWGDPPDDVVKFAMMQGLPREEAQELLQALLRERFGMLRGIGIRKIVTGVPLTCVPLASLLVFHKIGILPLKLFAITVMVGLYGVFLLYRGCFMVFLPRFEDGDVADK